MVDKLKGFLRVVAHTMLSFVAALVAGFTFWAFFRPLIGGERYKQIATQSPVMMALLLIVVALWGMVLYERWHDRRAFFAWVLPALWVSSYRPVHSPRKAKSTRRDRQRLQKAQSKRGSGRAS